MEPGHLTALVATLRADDYAPNTTSLYVNAIRGVMNEAWRQNLISHDQLLKIRSVKPVNGTRLSKGKNIRRTLIRELMEVCAADPRPQGRRDAAIIAILYGSGMRKSESVNVDLAQVDFVERSLQVLGKGNKQLIKYAPAWAFDILDQWLELRRSCLPTGQDDDPFLFNRIRRGNHITRERITNAREHRECRCRPDPADPQRPAAHKSWSRDSKGPIAPDKASRATAVCLEIRSRWYSRIADRSKAPLYNNAVCISSMRPSVPSLIYIAIINLSDSRHSQLLVQTEPMIAV